MGNVFEQMQRKIGRLERKLADRDEADRQPTPEEAGAAKLERFRSEGQSRVADLLSAEKQENERGRLEEYRQRAEPFLQRHADHPNAARILTKNLPGLDMATAGRLVADFLNEYTAPEKPQESGEGPQGPPFLPPVHYR